MTTRILLLDDDKAMFRAISRLVRPLDAAVLTAKSPERALQFCEDYEIQVIIADLNRKDIDVNQFLTDVNAINRWTRKIVLTSFAELDSTIDAINSGKINRYFTTPWDANELRKAIVEELNEYLEHRSASEKIQVLGKQSAKMEEKAEFTAKLLDGTAAMLAGSRYRSAISIFLPLLENKLPGIKAHAKGTAKIAIGIANALGLSTNEREQISLAAELHQLGFLGIPDHVLKLPLKKMNPSEAALYQSYPGLGASALAEQGENDAVTEIIRHHQENMDGGGYPSKLVGGFIPLGARIVRIASDFDDRARLFGRGRAYLLLLEKGNEVYDPQLLKLLGQILHLDSNADTPDDITQISGSTGDDS